MTPIPVVNSRLAPFALMSFVLGLVSCVVVTAPLSLVSGIVALIQIRNGQGELHGKVLAWIGIAISVLTLTFYAMYASLIPGLGWYHDRVLTNRLCGVPFSLGKPIVHYEDGPHGFDGDGYTATAYSIPSNVIGALQNQKLLLPQVGWLGKDWQSVGWKSPVDPKDLEYIHFAVKHHSISELAKKAIAQPSTRLSYFYQAQNNADGTKRITDVLIYIIDLENQVFIVIDRKT